MKRSDRTMASLLESTLARHSLKQEALDERLLADLRSAGFTQIRSAQEAYERLDAQRELPGFSQTQIDMVMYQRRSREKKGTAA